MRMKITDLSWGQEIVYIMGSTKKMYKGHIIGLSTQHYDPDCDSYKIIAEYYDEEKNLNFTTSLRLGEYKNRYCICYNEPSWCFANSTRYIEHVKRYWNTKGRMLFPKDNSKYKDLRHDNNYNQTEKKLSSQRKIICKIIEQGYIWYKFSHLSIDGNAYVEWFKQKDPQIEFDRQKNEYYIHFHYGRTRIKKCGTAFFLEKPKEDK